jgi:demethylmenaquinone methyltransferase/2-methoxy-6-polyprenyl-1,4-benzoquinol methylase
MANLRGEARSRYVRAMFTDIAASYDLMNRLMTFGWDRAWRKEVIYLAGLPARGQLLDLGSGTGDLVREALRLRPDIQATAADFTLEMMRIGREREGGRAIPWLGADSLCLPFPDSCFDAVISGFLMRNVIDLRQALAEQFRVVRPGGRVVVLDTTRPLAGPLSPLIKFYLHTVIPVLGGLITGHPEAYRYLPETTENFLAAETMASRLVEAGFVQVGFSRRMLGTVAIHVGVKP